MLRGFNLQIDHGETVALVGNSGNGKSTCLQLLERFYDPDRGSIYVDRFEVNEIKVGYLRSLISYVGQEPILFSTTIGENIRYGAPAASDADIVAAAKAADAHEFISKLPLGYDTVVGEKGGQLSGGQKQRIAIARALVRNPRILLLDEATSALDYRSEQSVQRTLDQVSRRCTTIVVSHRLSAIRGAHRIVFIADGRVVEEGTHSTLMAAKGHYYDMIMGSSRDGAADGDEAPKLDDEIASKTKGDDQQQSVHTKEALDEHAQQFFRKKSVDFDLDANTKQQSRGDNAIRYGATFRRILALVQSDWRQLVMGIVAALVIGSSLPMFAVLFAEVYGVSDCASA